MKVTSTLVDTVHNITAGNPFYIEEITQALLEDERVEERNGQCCDSI